VTNREIFEAELKRLEDEWFGAKWAWNADADLALYSVLMSSGRRYIRCRCSFELIDALKVVEGVAEQILNDMYETLLGKEKNDAY
jgi:hypothetical protein